MKFVKCTTSNQFNLTMSPDSWFGLWQVIKNKEHTMIMKGVHTFYEHLQNLIQGNDDFAELIAERAEQDDDEDDLPVLRGVAAAPPDIDFFAHPPPLPPEWGEERD